VLAKHPNVLFLGESSHLKFIKEKRDEGYLVLSDGELYEVFDIYMIMMFILSITII